MRYLAILISAVLVGCASKPGPDCKGMSLHDCTKQKEAIYYDEQARATDIACSRRPLNVELQETSRDIWQRTYDPTLERGHLRLTYCSWDPDYPDPIPDYIYDTSWRYPECPSKRSPNCVDGVWEPWE